MAVRARQRTDEFSSALIFGDINAVGLKAINMHVPWRMFSNINKCFRPTHNRIFNAMIYHMCVRVRVHAHALDIASRIVR